MNLLRVALYVYVMMVACPLRYWAIGSKVDTWVFALNLAAANGLQAGREVVFTYGPLGFLLAPQNIGSNLPKALAFQGGLWLLLAWLFADLFFRARMPVWNLLLFSFCFGLSAPLYWFNFAGLESLMIAAVLLLLVLFRLFGGTARFTVALVIIGALPFFKVTAGIVAFTALAGFLVDRLFRYGAKVLPDVIRALVISAAVAAILGLRLCPSFEVFRESLRGSSELAAGYIAAMSYPGPANEIVSALIAALLLGFAIWLQARADIRAASSQISLFAVPLFVSFRHGFVRQDTFHLVNYFCFLALALAIISLTLPLKGAGMRTVAGLLAAFLLIWTLNVMRYGRFETFTNITGTSVPLRCWRGLPFPFLQQRVNGSVPETPPDVVLDPEVAKLIGHSTVASLSLIYTELSNMRIVFYPTVQRYSAYTSYLDRRCATWVREKAPRFLLFDGSTIDRRDAWAETPAMWLEIYRLYETRYLGPRSLLLERRATPRFSTTETISRSSVGFPGELRFPRSDIPLLWTMKCSLSLEGELRTLLFRIPPVFAIIHDVESGDQDERRFIPDVLASPVLGNFLPSTLPQFAELLSPVSAPRYAVDRIRFDGPGVPSYSRRCEVEMLRIVR